MYKVFKVLLITFIIGHMGLNGRLFFLKRNRNQNPCVNFKIKPFGQLSFKLDRQKLFRFYCINSIFTNNYRKKLNRIDDWNGMD